MKQALLLFLLLLSACQPQSSQEPIVIGATLSLSGFGTAWGANAQKGIELAVEEVNAQGGINGRPLEVIYEDFKELDLKLAASAAQKLITVDEVSVILTQWAEDTQVVWPIAAEYNVITIAVSPGSANLTQQSPLLFRIRPSDEVFVRETIDYSYDQGARKAVLIMEQTSYFESMRSFHEQYWKEKTGNEMIVYEVPAGSSDFLSVLTKAKNDHPDAVFVQVNYGDQGIVFKQMENLGLRPKVKIGIQGDDKVLMNTAGSSAQGVVYGKYEPAQEDFRAAFLAKYGTEAVSPAEEGYDAIMILAKAMREQGTSTKELQEALSHTVDYPGASGTITIDPKTRERLGRDVQLMQIQNGESVALSSA